MFYSSYSAILHLNYFLWEYSLLRNTGCSYGCSPIPNRRKYVLFTVRGFCFFGALLRSFLFFYPPTLLPLSSLSLVLSSSLSISLSSKAPLLLSFLVFFPSLAHISSSFIDFLLIFVRIRSAAGAQRILNFLLLFSALCSLFGEISPFLCHQFFAFLRFFVIRSDCKYI